MQYYFGKTLTIPFDDAITRVTEALKKEGFGILTEIDVKETLKKSSTSTSGNIASSAHVIRLLPIKPCWRKT